MCEGGALHTLCWAKSLSSHQRHSGFGRRRGHGSLLEVPATELSLLITRLPDAGPVVGVWPEGPQVPGLVRVCGSSQSV